MRILVTYGSKRHATEGIARVIGDALTDAGHAVDVRPPRGIESLAAWDAVVIGGALYADRWHRDARRFVERHLDELEQMPVWFFSSGPLGDAHQAPGIPPTKQVARLMARVGARGHVTFGGALDREPGGLIAGAMARNGMGGDWRDMDAVQRWAGEVARSLDGIAPRLRPSPVPQRRLRWALALLALFVGLTAMAGGLELILWPQGAGWSGLEVSILAHTPFEDFVIPGVLLLVCVGLLNTSAGVLTARRHRWGERLGVLAGAVMLGWITIEMMLLRTFHPLHVLYFGLGGATLLVGWTLLRRRQAARTARVGWLAWWV